MTFYKIINYQISLNKNSLEIEWNDNHISRFHAKWIRFNCQCYRCCGNFSRNYTVDFEEIPNKLEIQFITIDNTENDLQVKFKKEILTDHVTKAPIDWLREKCYCDSCLEDKITKRDVITKALRLRESSGVNVVPTLQYDDVNSSDEGLFRFIKCMIEDGLCLLKDVPCPDGIMLVKKINNIEFTNYGELYFRSCSCESVTTNCQWVYYKVFEVKDTGVTNAAFTNHKLPLHQDQPNYEISPGFQFLQAIRFDDCVIGGESKLTDLFQVVEILRKESPEHFKTLCEVPTIYSEIDYSRDSYYESSKTNITLDYYGKVSAVKWSIQMLEAAQVKECDVERYYDALTAMIKAIRREKYMFKFRMKKGDMICFNNRRMLHAREAFQSNGGVRHLRGTYLKADDIKSKYMSLAHKLKKNVYPPKIGNHSSF